MKGLCSAITVTLAMIRLLSTSAVGQGSFQNLDFESTTVLQTHPPGDVSVTAAFPGWDVYYGTNQQTTVLYNDQGLGSTLVVLLGTNSGSLTGYRSIEGDFSVLLQGGVSISPAGLYPTAASIRQTGIVPASAHSILFKAQPDTLGVLSLILNGANIPYFEISTGPNYTLFGANISSFAGTSAELNLSLSRNPNTASSNWNIDSIEFSDQAIPEPSVATLAALGAVIVGWKLKRGAGSVGKKLKVGWRIEKLGGAQSGTGRAECFGVSELRCFSISVYPEITQANRR